MFPQQKKNKIPINKLHHYPESYMIKQRDPNFRPLAACTLDLRDYLLIKYFPKFYRAFETKTLDKARKVPTLKRMKKISVVDEGSHIFCSKNLWRIVFQNKFKCVDVYKHYPYYQEMNMSRYKAFSKITQIKLFDESQTYASRSRKIKKLPSLAWILSRNILPGMRNLKSLSLEIKSEKYRYLIEKANLLISILPGLKTLRVDVPQAKNPKDIMILSSLFKNKNVLKYATHLTLGRIAREDSCEVFKLLPKHCKNLVYLSFEVCENTDASYLKVLKDFEKLEGLRISVHDTFAFMDNFTASSSLKFFSLSFLDTTWKAICQELFAKTALEFKKDPSLDLLSPQNERANNFFGQFCALKDLISLELSAQDASGAVYFIVAFVNSLLSGIPSSKLQNFQLSLLSFETKDLIDTEADHLKINNLFNQIAKFTSLKTLNISISKCHFVLFGETNITFPQLTSFEFSGMPMFPDFLLEYFFSSVRKPPSSMPHTNDVNFSFKIFTLGPLIVRQFEALTKVPRNFRVKMLLLVVAIKSENRKDVENFAEEQKKSPVENVALKFGIQYHHSEYKKSLALLSEVFGKVSFKTYHRKDFDDEDFRDNEDYRSDSGDEVEAEAVSDERNDEVLD